MQARHCPLPPLTWGASALVTAGAGSMRTLRVAEILKISLTASSVSVAGSTVALAALRNSSRAASKAGRAAAGLGPMLWNAKPAQKHL